MQFLRLNNFISDPECFSRNNSKYFQPTVLINHAEHINAFFFIYDLLYNMRINTHNFGRYAIHYKLHYLFQRYVQRIQIKHTKTGMKICIKLNKNEECKAKFKGEYF